MTRAAGDRCLVSDSPYRCDTLHFVLLDITKIGLQTKRVGCTVDRRGNMVQCLDAVHVHVSLTWLGDAGAVFSLFVGVN